MFSDSGGQAVCTTNTSCLAHVLVDLDLQVLVGEARRVRAPSAIPSSSQISRASSGCDEPEKILSPSAVIAVIIAHRLRATMIA